MRRVIVKLITACGCTSYREMPDILPKIHMALHYPNRAVPIQENLPTSPAMKHRTFDYYGLEPDGTPVYREVEE